MDEYRTDKMFPHLKKKSSSFFSSSLLHCCELKVGRAERVAQRMNACLGSNSALPIKATEQQLSVVVILELQVCMSATIVLNEIISVWQSKGDLIF